MHRSLRHGERMKASDRIGLYAVGEFTAFNRFLDVSKSAVVMSVFVRTGVFIIVIMRIHGATNPTNPAARVGFEV
jgi:hypothetical protein